MQASPFTGAHSKLARARKHLDELRAAIAAFFAAQPYEVLHEEEISTGDLIYKLRICHEVPGDWSLIVGDVLHNLRSALDHLAWRLVELNNNTPSRHIQFVICANQAAFQRAAPNNLRGVSQTAMTFIENLHPYRGGDDLLWQLNELNSIDKHRLLLVTGSAFRSLGLAWKFTEASITLPLNLRPADRLFPLRHGVELLRVMKAARQSHDPSFPIQREEPKFIFDIGFADGVVMTGEPVEEKLEEMYTHIEKILHLADRQLSTSTI
jgi:hypothetical protein